MRHSTEHERIARQHGAWLEQAQRCHELLRLIAQGLPEPMTGDGTVVVRIDAAAWRAAIDEAAKPPPEPPPARA